MTGSKQRGEIIMALLRMPIAKLMSSPASSLRSLRRFRRPAKRLPKRCREAPRGNFPQSGDEFRACWPSIPRKCRRKPARFACRRESAPLKHGHRFATLKPTTLRRQSVSTKTCVMVPSSASFPARLCAGRGRQGCADQPGSTPQPMPKPTRNPPAVPSVVRAPFALCGPVARITCWPGKPAKVRFISPTLVCRRPANSCRRVGAMRLASADNRRFCPTARRLSSERRSWCPDSGNCDPTFV